jgi:hypothetical protein
MPYLLMCSCYIRTTEREMSSEIKRLGAHRNYATLFFGIKKENTPTHTLLHLHQNTFLNNNKTQQHNTTLPYIDYIYHSIPHGIFLKDKQYTFP